MTPHRGRSWADRAGFVTVCLGLGLVWYALRPHDKSVQVLFIVACAVFVASFLSGETRARPRR
jgi:hypothetical protein